MQRKIQHLCLREATLALSNPFPVTSLHSLVSSSTAYAVSPLITTVYGKQPCEA